MARARLATMAWRNIWRNRRRTLITLFGIVFGVFMAVLFTGIGDATYGQMIDHAARLGGGHVVVQHREYQDLPTVKKTVTDAPAVAAAAMELPGVRETATRITGAAMLSTAKNSAGTFFIGLDPAHETDETFGLLDATWEGEMLASADQEHAVVLGRGLANNLEAKLGSKVVYTVTDEEGEIVSVLVRVVGIVETGAPSLDAGLCLLPIDEIRKHLGHEPGEATMVAVFLNDHRDAATVAEGLASHVPQDAVALTWAEAQPDLAGFIAMKEGGAKVFEVIIMVLLAAGIFNTLFVSVMERLREFGIMAAVGFMPRQLFGLVMWESAWLALVGLLGSVLVIAGPYYHLSTKGIDYSKMIGEGGAEVAGVAMDPILYVRIHPESALVIAVVVVAATLVSGLYPAWRAGRANPADAIRLV
ncbi:ABC transporter permease [Paraliomyxa miuraensis]|uniref:ABC transporter permease n=1 Tax=Paraliomyxa miuraensis TaxID=376150 RepID=UPI00224E2A71|nr:ABC transporter permease [Paraliomyxa miuraensis]MCX4247099.1 ABC transporter permease [Paraliomyxa miuraensis]